VSLVLQCSFGIYIKLEIELVNSEHP